MAAITSTQQAGRQWLTAQLQQRGVHVDFAVYERQAPEAPDLLQRISELRGQRAVWLFSSSECVQHLVRCNTTWSWQAHAAAVYQPNKYAKQVWQRHRDTTYRTRHHGIDKIIA